MSSKSIKILSTQKHLNCTIKLTGSKSESNRALIMEALSEGAVQVLNVSEAADTVTLKNILHKAANQALSDQPREVNIGPAGTAMRFLSAYFTLQKGNVILTGSERMKQRPIGILVDALKTLGADIEYAEKEGYPPLNIRGPLRQKTDQIKIKGDISSQYISALLLIAPKLEQGLKLIIDGELTSKPYVEMTLAMMEQAGIRHSWTENEITISNQAYQKAEISVEPDWSAASYWYAIAALAEEASLFLPGLNGYSLQGDSNITEIMANFGITSQFKDGGVYLLKEAKKLERKIFDFKECPDLAQTVIVCCAALGHDALFTGLETLKIKETDRVNALQTELAKIGVKLIEKNQTYKLDCSELNLNRKISISTYDDHRMAMAFAPLALLIPELEIEDHLVVEKSYPDFWKHLELAGFGIEM
ncbi:3-phosphoshikimate 1-carboxyvinyltransferase [Daejeonella sp.]|jgi:3-phosphoshikimate 1-carboxyvinyltransferase|uniref:3-phosphoshikimate 1-carboxyvinyltransferase n=1 Tax=Daejeonella sp. TaxID=2805397 RepID=UPI0027BAB0A8|nr:3-phosphoshikimate 1-carboxyvinyltransferase [Daejeonella sp.]